MILSLPVAYAPRACGVVDTAQRTEPAWVHLVVVTAGAWPDVGGEVPTHPALVELDQRGTRAYRMWTPAVGASAAAVSLWTGRWPVNHGVLHDGLSLPPGAWTLASAAAARGAQTAAFLQRPLVSCQGIAGFDLVIEEPMATPEELADGAVEFLARAAGNRRVCWVHLDEAGPEARDVGTVLERIHAQLGREGDRVDALTVVTGFRTTAGGDDSFRIPFWAEMPSGLFASRRGPGNVSLVDLGGLLAQVMRLDLPDAGAGQARIQSRADEIARVLKGGGGEPWILIESARGDLLRFGNVRIEALDRTKITPDEITVWQVLRTLDGGERLAAVEPDLHQAGVDQYHASLAAALRGATRAVPSDCD